MARKYDYYQLAKEFGVNNYECYQDAFAAYQRTSGSATLYGVDSQDEFTCIMTKKQTKEIKIMKTKKELKKLSNAIDEAVRAYHKAIFDNLKESGKEYGIKADWKEEDCKGIHLSIVGRHDDLVVLTIDKVRVNSEKGVIEAHVCEEDYDGCDYWMMASELGDDADYLYDNIIW